MRMLVLVLLCALRTSVAFAQQPAAPAKPAPPPAAAAAAPQKVAEGAYGKFDSWTLWATPDDQLKAEIEMSIYSDLARAPGKPLLQSETLALDTDFTMRGFRYVSKNFRGLPDGALDCSVKPESLDCVSSFEKQSGRGRIAASGGYATQFGVEIALLDLPWFYTTLVAESDRDPKQPRTLGILTIAFDGDTPETLVTGGGRDAEVKYAGVETIKVLGHMVKGHKFQITARTYAATVWVSERGLLLAADWADMRIELTRFRQWVEVVPGFPLEPATAPAKK
jgi:hypothetical protein